MDTMVETWYSCLVNRWWIVGLTIVTSSISIIAADYLGINKPWPLSIVLGAILSFMVMEAYPYAWTLGNGAHIILWVVLSCMTYLLPQFIGQNAEGSRQTLWDRFKDIDFAYTPSPAHKAVEDERQVGAHYD